MWTFTVSHAVDIDCDAPEEAAQIFLDFLRDERTDEDGNAFTVTCGTRSWEVVLFENGRYEIKRAKKGAVV